MLASTTHNQMLPIIHKRSHPSIQLHICWSRCMRTFIEGIRFGRSAAFSWRYFWMLFLLYLRAASKCKCILSPKGRVFSGGRFSALLLLIASMRARSDATSAIASSTEGFGTKASSSAAGPGSLEWDRSLLSRPPRANSQQITDNRDLHKELHPF